MEILWINFFVVYMSSLLARYFSKPTCLEFVSIKPNKILAFFVVTSLVIVSGLRKNIGDTYLYMHSYTIENNSFHDISLKGDIGFNIFQAILHYISNDPQTLVFATALITNVLVVDVLYKHSRMFELSVFVFIASGLFTVTMNGIRQSLAAAIIFASTKYILEGNLKKFILVILLASTIHQTAIIFIPIYFIVRKKAWTKITFLLLLLAVVIAFSFDTFSSLLFDALDNTQYGHYSNFNEGGANIFRVLVTGAPILVAYLGREKLRELWPKSDIIVNLSLLGFIFMVIATKNWIFARFDVYFGMYSLILISWIIHLFKNNERYLVYYGLLGCYLFYFYYEQVISLDIIYSSDYLKL